MLHRLLIVGAIAAPLATLACSASNNAGSSSGFGGTGGGTTQTGGSAAGDSTGSLGPTGSGGGLNIGGGSGEGGHVTTDCAQATTLVYVVSQERKLYSFDPGALKFTLVGPLDCPGSNGGQPFSMAVDRTGRAWVLYNGGSIFNVDITTAACTATGYHPGQNGFQQFGMGFSANSVGSTDETLYLANYSGAGLGSLDLTTLQVTSVGAYDTIHSSAELTGTGDARLFGFFETSTVIIGEIDKTNAHILSKAPQPSVSIGTAWAFAFWGGSFWLFTNPNGNASQVDQYDPVAGTTNTVVPNVGGFSIVGAGVSTCAPTTIPK